MNGKKILCVLALTLTIAGMHATAGAQSRTLSSSSKKLEGTWNVTETTGDGFQFQWHYTFGPGRTANDGTLIATSNLDLTPDPIIVPSQGVWIKTGARTFATTRETFSFDSATGAPVGPAKWRSAITLDATGNAFTGTEHLDVFDLDGNLVFSADDTVEGIRMEVEPLTSAPAGRPAVTSARSRDWRLPRS